MSVMKHFARTTSKLAPKVSNILLYKLIFCPQVEEKKCIHPNFLEKIVLITRIWRKKCFFGLLVEHTSPYKSVGVQSNRTAYSLPNIKF